MPLWLRSCVGKPGRYVPPRSWKTRLATPTRWSALRRAPDSDLLLQRQFLGQKGEPGHEAGSEDHPGGDEERDGEAAVQGIVGGVQ